jgi:ketosteroid isomerase-like protein
MPFYRFLIHGWDPDRPKDDKGFFTTRHVYAADERRASQKVRALLMEEFTTGVSADIWGSGPPSLAIEKAYRIRLHQLRSAPNKGSTFYGLGTDDG